MKKELLLSLVALLTIANVSFANEPVKTPAEAGSEIVEEVLLPTPSAE